MQNESPEDRQTRLTKQQEYMRARRKIEATEQKDMQLAQAREYKRQKLQNKTPQDRQLQSKVNQLAKLMIPRKMKMLLISQFLLRISIGSVAVGPLYIYALVVTSCGINTVYVPLIEQMMLSTRVQMMLSGFVAPVKVT